MPQDLKVTLENDKQALDFFQGLTASQKNRFIEVVASAKKQETADAKIIKVTNMLKTEKR
jgi:uncharacterized protein YdeI (YjbR/CyaY-like superfamily)